MGFRRMKLLTRPDRIPAGENPCTKFCDPDRNYDGLCPLLCLPLCFSTCKQTLLLPQRPPRLFSPPPGFTASSSSAAAVHTVRHFRAPFVLSILAGVAVFLSITFFLVYKIVKSTAGGASRTPPPEEEQGEDGGVEGLSDAVEHSIWYIRTAGLGSSIINRIPVSRYKRGEGSGESCSVCLSEFEGGEMVRVLPRCHHTFHVHCIDTWLRSHTSCPVCRSAIVAVHHYDDHEDENNSSDNSSRREEEIMVLDHQDLERERGGVVGNYEGIHMNEGGSGRIIINRRSVSMEFYVMKRSRSCSSSSSSVAMKEPGRMRSLSCNGAIFSSR